MSTGATPGDPERASAPSADRGGTPFALREVRLAGFGLHREPVRFVLPSGPAVWHAPNESGKSTMVQGIAAILFGLPATTDRAKFGIARFRSLEEPRQFWGELAFDLQGRHYSLRRSFASHRVRLVEETSRGVERIFEGEHNPAAHSPAGSAWPRVLRDRIGCGSLELFLETFCIAQPLADRTELSTELQHLLSGSRSGRVDDVLERLFAGVKRLTRATGDLGLVRPGNNRPANQREAGEIEALEEEIESASRTVAAAQDDLERQNRHALELEEIAAQARALREEIDRLEEQHGTVRRWSELERECERRREALRQTRASLSRLAEVEAALARTEPELAERFAPFREAPESLARQLDHLAAALREDQAAASAVADASAERARWSEEAGRLRQRLEEEFAPVRGRPDLPALHDQLCRARERRETRAGKILRLEEEIDAAAAETMNAAAGEAQPGRDPDAPTPSTPVDPAQLRLRVDGFLGDLERYRQSRARREEIARELAGFRFLEEEGRIERLREKVEAEESLRDLRPRVRLLEQEVARREIDAQRRALETGRRTVGPASGPAAAHLLPVWVILLIAVATGGGLHLLARLPWPVVALATAVVLSILLAVRILQRRRNAASPSTLPAPEAGGPATEEAAPSPPESPGDESRPEDLHSLRAEVTRLEEQIEQRRPALGPFADTTAAELARLEERAALLREEGERLALAGRDLLAPHLPGQATDDWEERPVEVLSAGLREALQLPAAPVLATCGEAATWLASLDRVDWQAMIDRAAERRARTERLGQAREERDRLAAEAEADREVEELQEKLLPFSAATPRAELEAQVAECVRIERQLGDAEARRESVEAADALEARRTAARHALETAIAKTREIWPEGPALEPATLEHEAIEAWRETEREARRAWDRARKDHDEVRHLLEAARATSREELECRETDQAAALGEAIRDRDDLEAATPTLSALRTVDDPVERARRIEDEERGIARRLEACRDRERTGEERRRTILRELAQLEGRAAPNLARLELDTAAAEARLRRLRRDRDARVLAFRWVREAADAYQSGFREDLEARISEHFATLTGRPGRAVRLDERFRVAIREPDGGDLAIAQLSQGAADQLLLSIRFAVADLLSGAVPLPLFLDDPFVHCDEARLEQIRCALSRMAATRQWILLTHRSELAGWARQIRIESVPQT